MDAQTELEEFIKYTKQLVFAGSNFELETFEGHQIAGELTPAGLVISSSDPPLQRQVYDDFTQMITEISPEYRRLFAEELMKKLSDMQ